MSRLLTPYIQPDPQTYTLGPWQRMVAGEAQVLSQEIPGWAPGTPIDLRRSLEIDRKGFLQSAGLPEHTELWINVSWIGSGSKIRTRLRRSGIDSGITVHDASLPADLIGGTVTVETTICLATAGSGTPGIASAPGSIFVRDRHPIVLEGDSSTFPTRIIDFESHGRPGLASWFVRTTPDLDAAFGGHFRLEINEKDARLVKAIESEKPNNEERAFINGMLGEVGQFLLEYALGMEAELRSRDDFDEGSVGAVLKGLLERTRIRTQLDYSDPFAIARLRTELQDGARKLGFGREL